MREGWSNPIKTLKQDELELTRKIFQRVSPTKDITLDPTTWKYEIDPYWSPFNKLTKLRQQVTAEFDDYATYASVAEQKKERIAIKKSFKRCSAVYNPYSASFMQYHERKASEPFPKPFRLPDTFWEQTPLQARLSREKITWKDIDIIQHCLADNGYILPRRTTTLSRKKQNEMVKAVKVAQHMALIPYTWRVKDHQAMPLMDPLQWMVDRLTENWTNPHKRDLRSRAMLRVMMEKYPELNFRLFLKHEAQKAQEEGAWQPGQAETDTKAAPPSSSSK